MISTTSTPEADVTIPTRTDRIIVTIDGPAATGKSSVARALAARLGVQFLDTGAMYRGAAAVVIDQGVDPTDQSAVAAAVEAADLHFDWGTDPPTLLAFLQPVAHRIRERDVNALVSPLSALPALRHHLVRKQRVIAQQHPRLVSEGRDQGSVVFPEADAKIYLEASAAERARRRAEQLRAQGYEVEERTLEAEIVARDRADSTRAVGPLVCPPDAWRLDTSSLTFDQVVATLEAHVRSRIGTRLDSGGGGGLRA